MFTYELIDINWFVKLGKANIKQGHTTQLTFTYSKSTIETLEKDVKYI